MEHNHKFEHLCGLLLELLIEQGEVTITMQAKADVQIIVSNSGGGGGPIVIDANGIPASADAGVAYNGAFKASGGSGSGYTWANTSQSVAPPAVSGFPTGLTLNADGTVTGTVDASVPDQTAFEAEATVTDSTGASASQRVRSFGNR
jgi:hypothetical protein